MIQISANSGSQVSVCGEISIFSKEYGPQFKFIRLSFVQMGFKFENSIARASHSIIDQHDQRLQP